MLMLLFAMGMLLAWGGGIGPMVSMVRIHRVMSMLLLMLGVEGMVLMVVRMVVRMMVCRGLCMPMVRLHPAVRGHYSCCTRTQMGGKRNLLFHPSACLHAAWHRGVGRWRFVSDCSHGGSFPNSSCGMLRLSWHVESRSRR